MWREAQSSILTPKKNWVLRKTLLPQDPYLKEVGTLLTYGVNCRVVVYALVPDAFLALTRQ
jgi:hypothetical protein